MLKIRSAMKLADVPGWTRRRARGLTIALAAALAVSSARSANATPEYPLVLDATYGTECPQLSRCLICHTSARGGQSTAVQPFAETLGRYGLNRGRDAAALQTALAALPDTTDSDRDGAPDEMELMLCGNPSGEELGTGPQYGCDGAQLVPGSASDAAFGLMALLAAGVVARRRAPSRAQRRERAER
jgi:hypothetical protein